MKSLVILSSFVAAIAVAPAAQADTVSAVLAAQYFEVAHNVDPDFSNGTPVVANGSQLGPNGLPVATGGVSDLDTAGEITWWSPTLNKNVVATGTGTITLPYSSNMYAPNSTGMDDATEFETAIFKGDFSLLSASTVSFDLGSDDDSFIYVDGTLFGQNPGIHGVSTVDFTSPTLSAGLHSISVFYADRESTGAALSLNLDAASSGIVVTPPTSAVPEPVTWAMMIGGFGLVGGMMRRAHRKSEEAFTRKVRSIATA